MAPYFGFAIGLAAAAITIVLRGWPGLAWVLLAVAGACIGLAYVSHYVLDLARGRTIDPPDGKIEVVDNALAVTTGELATRVSLAKITGATLYTIDEIDTDACALADVLEVALVSGVRVRIPATLDGFDAAVTKLRTRSEVTARVLR